MNYNRLETSLIDVIKEEQAKLGYMKEKISLYYPLSSLNHFFESKADAAGMMEILKDFPFVWYCTFFYHSEYENDFHFQF